MRFSILKVNRRFLARGAAILVVGGLATGCSSSAMRFSDGVDGIFTASTDNQRSIIKPQSQPYPGDAQSAAVHGNPAGSVAQAAPTPVDVAAGSVSRGDLAPPSGAGAAKPTQPAPTLTAAVTPPDRSAIEAAKPQVAAEEEVAGWSRAGGTQITAREGETVYNLSRRFGVPADVLMRVNGLSGASALRAGQKVVIPTYVYSSKSPVSAPDSNPKVADAKSSRGMKSDLPADKVPTRRPTDNVAVLPQEPKLKESGAASANAAPTDASGSYTVKQGDTLAAISRKTGVSTAALKSANGMTDGLIRVGQKLTIPDTAARTTSAKPTKVDAVVTSTTDPAGSTGEKVAAYTPPRKAEPGKAEPRKAERVIEDAEQEASAAPDSTGIGRMRWPVRGRVITGYGGNSGGKANDGIDIAVPEGTPVKAAENGVVIYAGDGLKEFGNTVLVRHEDGLVTVYGHASELKVTRGEKVKRGQEIATSGMSGSADSPKLHFEVRKNSAPVDPKTFLE
ncbi:peptidoglycan DD-metalloendopeptidase family protein [Mesorhizobium sp. L-8-3]|uniref:peptidoglycan DD-metalloendopeptidase family protein n=1 Tax=Mesorhizobium sp. L-8-3 TaxID=2744522 RepID=UPI0019277A70|nr:peptidoglycan DD-metalloendopeptidase family protein [Mesorhizobium sp. L-8-3]